MSCVQLARLQGLLCVMVLGLVCLGAAVRAMNAGLACPDWPLCFGQFIPDYHPQVYLEFFHRGAAGIVSVFTTIMSFLIFRSPAPPRAAKILMALALALLLGQVVLGGLTVLKLLHAATVVSHLALGLTFLATLAWVYWLLAGKPRRTDSNLGLRCFLNLFVVLVFAQILLGGLVSSNYAGLACPDFPLCFGEWIPTLQGKIGLQVLHRLGAYLVFLVTLTFFLSVRNARPQPWLTPSVRSRSALLMLLMTLQVLLGILNIALRIPPLITVAHLGLAAAILLTVLSLRFSASPPPA